ncbi:MAG: PepSY domain-containing protein [Candidatus Rokubacteria bacterium]|nr:PepSY domain-containing protein [Candidatus Rokubacteria bacterium]
MKRVMTVVLAVALVAVVAGAALAFGPGMGPGRMGFGPQMMGAGFQMGPGMMGAAGGAGCPGMAGATSTAPQAITEEKAKELATEYAARYFKGFTVERVLPFAGRLHTMYQVELRGPKGETRVLHVNPWGGVMPFGGRSIEG